MYLCVRGTDFVSSYDFSISFETVLTVGYYFVFHFISLYVNCVDRHHLFLAYIKGVGLWCLTPLSTIFQLYLDKFFHVMFYRLYLSMSGIGTFIKQRSKYFDKLIFK